MRAFALMIILVGFNLSAMESGQELVNGTKDAVVKAMTYITQPLYERAFKIIDALKPQVERFGLEQVQVLKNMATQNEYVPLIEYAFDKKKIRATDELASHLLLEAAGDQNAEGNLKKLLDYNVDPNKPGRLLVCDSHDERCYTPVVVAAMRGCYRNVRVLLKAGASANSCQPHENLPLVEAIARYHKWFRNRQPSLKDSTGLRYFYYQAVMSVLNEKGADEHKDNGRDIQIHDNGRNITCRTAFEMKCRLGYNGI